MTRAIDERWLLGDVAMAGAFAERVLRILLAGLIESQYGDIMAAGHPLSTLADNCKAIIDVHPKLDDKQRKHAKDMIGEIKGHMAIRNKLLHGLLAVNQSGPGGPEGEYALIFSKLRKPQETETISIGRIRKVAEGLWKTSGALLTWTMEWVPPGQQAHPLPAEIRKRLSEAED